MKLTLLSSDGVTVCSLMLITTVLYMCVSRYVWNHHWILVALFGIFLIIDLYFMAANAVKFFEGCLNSFNILFKKISFFFQVPG